MFVALRAERAAAEALQQLSPRVMAWAPHWWLVDLGVTASYWRLQAQQQGVRLPELIRRVLAQGLAEHPHDVAVLAEHPWPAILLATYLHERQLTGFIERGDRIGSALFRDLSWQSFWQASEQLGEHWAALKVKRFQLGAYKRACRLLQSMVERLGMESPWALHSVGPAALGRRYGRWLQRVWEWTYQYNEMVLVEGFPWRAQRFPVPAQVQRHLECPLSEWESLVPLLQEDFGRLYDAGRLDARVHIVSLEWRLVRDDLSHLTVPISFRYPHPLHLEQPTYQTALLQAHYSFTRVLQQAAQQHYEDTGVQPPPLVGWSLALTESLVVPAQMYDLFGASNQDEAQLLQLENRLAVPLQGFDVRNDWSPAEAFAVCERDQLRLDNEQNLHYGSLWAAGKSRPLFLLAQAQPLKRRAHAGAMWEFRERTMAKWWRPGCTGRAPVQDYYRYVDDQQRAWWVCRTGEDAWYVHGVFA